MQKFRTQHPSPRRWLGSTRVALVVAVAVVALVGGLTAVLVLRGDPPTDPAPASDPNAEIAELQEQFKRYIENRLDMTDLLPDVKAYTRKYPDELAGHILLAQVLMKLELYAEAYPALDRAAGSNPDNFELRKLTGTCAAKLEQWDEAERHLDAAHELREDVTVVLQLANVYFHTGRLDVAERAYNFAKGISGQSPPHKANAGLAEVCAARGEYDRALRLIDLALKWADGDSEAPVEVYQLSKVRLLFDDGQWALGERLLDDTLRAYPAATYTLSSARLRARLHAHTGDPARAAGEFELLASGVVDLADQSAQDRADLFAELAHWQLEAGNTPRAREAVTILRGLEPDHPRLAALEARAANAE